MNDTNSAYSAPIPSRKIRFHQRRSAEERRSWVKRHERSGQTLKQFCEEHGLALSSFCLWRRQFAQGRPGKPRAAPGALVEVPLRSPATFVPEAADPVATICLPDGTRIDVRASAEIPWLTNLLHAVRGMGTK